MNPTVGFVSLSFEDELLKADVKMVGTAAKFPSVNLKFNSLSSPLSWTSKAYPAELTSSYCTQVGGLVLIELEQVSADGKKTGEFKILCVAHLRSRP